MSFGGQSISSGSLTADVAVRATKCYLSGVVVITNGAANASVILYDNATTATGTVLARIDVLSTDLTGGVIFVNPVRALFGIFLDITGAGASTIVYTI